MAPQSAYETVQINSHTKTNNPSAAPKQAMEKLKDGYSVEEVFEKRIFLKDKLVKVRGVVTKISHNIMSKNWVHIEDGSGNEGSDDLVFTTNETPNIKIGDTVIASGVAVADKDFGYGYYYPVIVEQSYFKLEK